MRIETNQNTRKTWVIYFVGFDDPRIEPYVGFEPIETTFDAEQRRDDAQMTALVRGGHVLAVVEDEDDKTVAHIAAALEKEILRMR